MPERQGSTIKHSITPAISNVVSVFQELNPNRISTDDIKTSILDIYGSTTKIVLSQFPDLLAVIAPEIQISVVAEGRRIQIVNQKSSELEGQAVENFLKLVADINSKIIGESGLQAYGINYSAKIELINGGSELNTAKLLKKISVNNPETLEQTLGSEVVNSSFHIVYKYEDNRLELRLDPELTIELEGTNKINSTLNVHFVTNSFPEYGSLVEIYKSYLTKFEQDCGAIIQLL